MIIFDDDDLLSIMYICMYLYHCLETYLKPMHVLNQLLKFITGMIMSLSLINAMTCYAVYTDHV